MIPGRICSLVGESSKQSIVKLNDGADESRLDELIEILEHGFEGRAQ